MERDTQFVPCIRRCSSVRSHKIIQDRPGWLPMLTQRTHGFAGKETRSRAARQLVKYKMLGDKFELMNNSSLVGCVFGGNENTRKYTRPVTLKSHNFPEIPVQFIAYTRNPSKCPHKWLSNVATSPGSPWTINFDWNPINNADQSICDCKDDMTKFFFPLMTPSLDATQRENVFFGKIGRKINNSCRLHFFANSLALNAI